MGQVESAMRAALTGVSIMLLDGTQINIMSLVRSRFLKLPSIYFNNILFKVHLFNQELSPRREKH